MARVLIVSRTQMANGICVGGINMDTNELIRIHNNRGGNLTSAAPYQIGDVWEMKVERAWNARPRPHVEDRQTTPIQKIKSVGDIGIIEYIKEHHGEQQFTKGQLQETFEGCLLCVGNKNYINREKIPSFSTQFWIADKDLIHEKDFYGKHYYRYDCYKIKFVGFKEPIDKISQGSFVRLSLANWWNNNGQHEDRCYLQISGWYGL